MTDVLICPKCSLQPPQAEPGDRCPLDGVVLVLRRHWEMRANDPLLGRVLGGKYAIVGFIAEGGFGSVYRAIQEPVGRVVAVKVLAENQQKNEDLRQRFFREARVVARLSHPCCVVLHDYGEEADGRLYMVFEFVDGVSLVDVLRAEGPLPARRAATLMRGVLGALKEAHALGLIHRDLKPSNIMVVRGSFGEEDVKVLDFGIAKVISDDGPQDNLRTRQGLVLGTPHYMAPEQARGEKVDARSDLYAVGVLLYECLVGRPPFDGTSDIAVLMAQIQHPIPQIPAHLNVPPALATFVQKALAKKAAERFQTAEDMASSLSRVVDISAVYPVIPQPSGSSEVPETAPTEVLRQTPKPVAVAVPRPAAQGSRPVALAVELSPDQTSNEMPALAVALQETPAIDPADMPRLGGDDTPAGEAEFSSPDMTEQVDVSAEATAPNMKARTGEVAAARSGPDARSGAHGTAAEARSGAHVAAAEGRSGAHGAAAEARSGVHGAPNSGQLHGERISVQVPAARSPRRTVTVAVVLAVVAAGGTWWLVGRGEPHATSRPDDQTPVIVPVNIGPDVVPVKPDTSGDTLPPLPKEPFARVVELARRNEAEAAELALIDLLLKTDDPQRVEMARRVRTDASLRDLVARPAVQAALAAVPAK